MPSDRPLLLADYVDRERARIVETLFDWLRIPSISAQPDHADDVRASATFIGERFDEAGFEHVALIETAGAPAVYADWLDAGADKPTVLVYGHHDVQPVDPLDQWTSPPFTPVIVDGDCLARGAVDDKGQTLYELEAARGLLQRQGSLPVNLKFIVEGEEEIGSPHFEALLEAERDRLACDVVVVSDTGMWSRDVPSICTGMRGLVAFDVFVETGTIDLHSGSFGGAVPNPAHLIARAIAALHDADGHVTIPGFYDDVRPLTAEEQASMAALPFDEAAWTRTAGVRRLEGEAGYSTLERVWTRPTAEVTGITVGYGGPGIKTIVPAGGNAKFTFRLVADQDPDTIGATFEGWLRAQFGDGVSVDIRPAGAVAPALTPVDHPAMTALRTAIERVWQTPPLFTREGGSGPEEALGRILEAPVLYLGIALPDDRFHAPNEKMDMNQFWKGLLAAGELLHELGELQHG